MRQTIMCQTIIDMTDPDLHLQQMQVALLACATSWAHLAPAKLVTAGCALQRHHMMINACIWIPGMLRLSLFLRSTQGRNAHIWSLDNSMPKGV